MPVRKCALPTVFSLMVALLATWALLRQLGNGSLNDWDEATYAEVTREMVQTADWITPHWNGFPFHDKPPLFYWLAAPLMQAGVEPELAVRIPSAFAGLTVIAFTALLGRSMFDGWTGLIAATLLLIPSGAWWSNFVLLARQGMLDVPLAALNVWALW